MKKFFLVTLAGILFSSCSSNSSGDVPNDDVDPSIVIENPVAADDRVTANEDSDNTITGFLDNDTVTNSARITSFDTDTTAGGSITDNRDGTYLYEPPRSFSGEDTFTYTLCDNESTPNCSTATVTISVEDEGSPLASDDAVFTVKNSTLIIENVLDNDEVLDNASFFSVDDNATTGTALLDSQGIITYTPDTDFTGQDTFLYTICDDDSPETTCSSATVTVEVLESISLNIPADLDYYYGDLGLTENTEVNYQQLQNHTVKNHTTILSYGQRHQYLYNADEDLSNSDNVTLMYSGENRYWEEYTSGTNSYMPQTFNTEHVYPQSLLVAADAVTDLHHLRSCDADVNSSRSNYPFIMSSGTYQVIDNSKWYPGDDWRGDIARMIFYVNVRYGETFEKVGGLELFLEWNVADPVSDFEIQRNTVIEGAQGVRNPFIDNPYLATLIWDGADAENKWE